jgi:GDP-D-mannose dehydratase
MKYSQTSRSAQQNRTWHPSLHAFGIIEKVKLVQADFTDLASVIEVLRRVKPDEVPHLAAQNRCCCVF